MKEVTTQELMQAHNVVANNTEAANAAAVKAGSVVTPIDPYRPATPFPPDHPFGNNDNNRRVVERIQREQAKLRTVAVPAPLDPGAQAAKDLALAAELDKDDEPVKTDAEIEAESEAVREATLAAARAAAIPPAPVDPNAAPAPPPAPAVPPAWKPKA